MPKKLKGGTLWDFSTSILSQNSKKIEGDPLGEKFSPKKVAMAKKAKREPFGVVRYCMLLGKPFWFSSLGQLVEFGVFLEFCRTFGVELFWLLQMYRKKTLTKSHDYSRLFSLVKRRLKNNC